MTKKQSEFMELIQNRERKKLNQICREFFSRNLEENLDFVTALLTLLKKDFSSPLPEKVLTLAKELLAKVRSRFVQLPTERIVAILKVYHRQVMSDTAQHSELRFNFDLAQALGGTRREEYRQARRVMEHLVSLVYQYRLPENVRDLKVSDILMQILLFLFGLIALNGITHTWENLIASAKDDQEARLLLRKILYLYLFYSKGEVEFVPASKWNTERDLMIGWPSRSMVALGFTEAQFRLPVPDQYLDFLEELEQQLIHDIEEKQTEFILLMGWFGANKDRFQMVFEKMWEEIKTKPKHALRSEGKDRVRIDVKAMRKLGYQTIQFFSENLTFPQTKAKFWLKEEGEPPYSLSFVLDPEKTALPQYVVYENMPANHPLAVVDQLIVFIALNCYWRIITNQTGWPKLSSVLPELPPLEPENRIGRNKRTVSPSLHIVRPFFRALPEGYRASGEAINHSLEVFRTAPIVGFTFVREHLRGYTESQSVEPLFGYSEKDLGYKE